MSDIPKYDKELTDDFMEAYGDASGWSVSLIAEGLIPEAVDPNDPRVVELIAKCRAAQKA